MPTVAINHGVPGIGKTSMWAYAPDPLFLMVDEEVGLKMLIAQKRLPNVAHFPEPARSAEEVIEATQAVATGKIKCKTFVTDTANSVIGLIYKQVCAECYNNSMVEFMSFHAGYETSIPYIANYIRLLAKIRDRGIAITLIAHTRIKTFKNPLGPDYDRYIPQMHDKAWELLNNFADLVLFSNYEVTGEKASKGKIKTTTQQTTAYLYPVRSPAFDAKNRHGLTGKIAMGKSGQEAWNNLERNLKSCRATGKQEVEPEEQKQAETESQPETGKEAA